MFLIEIKPHFLSVILGVLLGVFLTGSGSETSDTFQELPQSSKWYGNEEIRIFRKYLTLQTMHPNIDYGK